MKTAEQFKAKETKLNKALKRVQDRLAFYLQTKDQDHPDWNDWHDLEERITQRLWDNWSAFKDWHWEKFGFNVY